MSVLPGFITYCSELLAAAGEVRSRRMFGGVGLYVDEAFVAIIVEDTLYLKADDQTRASFQGAGGRPFQYSANDRQATMDYWTVPPDAMDAPAAMLPWARLARAAALRSRDGARKPPKKKKQA